jgi:hypothetical protein
MKIEQLKKKKKKKKKKNGRIEKKNRKIEGLGVIR